MGIYLKYYSWIKENFPETSEKENLVTEFTQFLFSEKLRKNNLHDALVFIRNQIKYFKNPENQKCNDIICYNVVL